MKLHIEKPLYGGAGLARHEGQAVFVPFTLPGEAVEARLIENKGSYSTAEVDAVLEPSPARTDPPCPYFGPCGGCHYQHATYAAQVEMKIAVLRETLERAHIRDIPAITALTGDPLGYRNRIRLHVQREPLALCYKLRRSHANLPVVTCPIAAPVLQNAIAILTHEAATIGFADWATEVELFTNPDGSALLAAFWTKHPDREAPRLLKELWPRLQQHLPALVGAGILSVEQRRQPSRLLAHTSESSLQYDVAGRSYRVNIGSFFQVNGFLLAPLVDYVTANESGAAAWDLYSGVGLFSLPLAEKFSQVTAVESSASSVRDLRENLRGTHHRIVAADTAAFLSRAVQQRTPAPDLIVLDPPRAGLGREVTTALGQLRAPRLTYVSCDPSTLSRDVAALLQNGYAIRSIRLVDLFPQTYHLESVVHLTRG